MRRDGAALPGGRPRDAGLHLRAALLHHLPRGGGHRRVLPQPGEGPAAGGVPPGWLGV